MPRYKKPRSYTASDLDQAEIEARVGLKTKEGETLRTKTAVILYAVKQLPKK